MPNRCILHSDANCFYASVEMLLNPELRGKAVAVCGSTEDRHGIVLARSEKAKKAGVKTGQANWEARQTCPGLIVVPPHYDQYCKFSRLLRNIYLRYTDLVEPYGMDECWLDVTGSERLMGSGEKIAEEAWPFSAFTRLATAFALLPAGRVMTLSPWRMVMHEPTVFISSLGMVSGLIRISKPT